jgi:hypothetical protein
VETSVVEVQDVLEGTRTVIQTVGGMFFPPNTFFYVLDPSRAEDERSQKIIESARDEGMGIIILRSYFHQSQDNAPQPKRVNLWIRKKSPNINLAILTAIQLERNGEGAICLLQVVSSAEEVEEARQYLTRLKALMRLSSGVAIEVLVGDFKETLKSAPAAEINIFGVQARFDIALVREVFALVNTTVLFLGDSQHESALA